MNSPPAYDIGIIDVMIASAILDIYNRGLGGYGFGEDQVLSTQAVVRQFQAVELARFMVDEGIRLPQTIDQCGQKLATFGGDNYFQSLVNGLVALNFCSDRFHSGQERYGLLRDLSSMEDGFQFALFHLFQRLIGSINWMERDREMVGNGHLEVSFIFWVVKLGPRGLAAGWEEGKFTVEIILAAEDAWVMSHIEQANYNAKRRLLRECAQSLQIWGLDLFDEFKQRYMTGNEEVYMTESGEEHWTEIENEYATESEEEYITESEEGYMTGIDGIDSIEKLTSL